MLDKVEGEAADQVDVEHLCLKGTCELGPRGDAGPVGDAELPVSVDGRRAHQVADARHQVRIRLAAGGEALDHVLEEADAAVGPRQHEFAGPVAPGLLIGRVAGETRDVIGGRHAVEQAEGGVPGVRDHPVAAPVGVELAGIGDQRVGALRPPRVIEDMPITF